MNRPFKKDDNLTQQDIKRYNGYIWKTVITGFVIVALLIGSTALGLFGELPSLRDLENPKSNVASEIYSAEGKLFGRYYVDENRSPVTYDKISPNVINALVATEDNHFYDHSGIDFWRSFSIIFYNMIGKRQGASTITQQLALNQFSEEGRAKGVIARGVQKLKEQIIAVRLEKHYTKQEIITMYLNTVYYGSGSYGISAAASTFFNTTPDKLTPDQAAVLVGTLKGPAPYSPVGHPDNALGRRNFILARMSDAGFLTDGQVKEFQQKPLGIKFRPISDKQGLAPYFRKELKDAVKKLLAENNIVKNDGTPYDLNRDGLKIYTTIDATMQEYAEEAQRKHMSEFQNTFNKQWKGINLKKAINNYDRIVNAGMRRSKRWEELTLEGKSEEEIIKDFNTVDTVNVFTWHGRVDTLMKPIDSVVYTKMLIWNSMMSMDPTTGYIKAWVGGINFQQTEYDQVYQGKRQVGSTAKPFTYAAAIDQGISPCTSVDNVPVTIGDWTPRSDPKTTLPGRITLKTALAHSQNYVTAWVMDKVGAMPVFELIKKMGIRDDSDLKPYPSIALGVFNASVYDMTGAYSVFVNQGVWTEPTFLLRIEDKNGTVLYTHTPKKQQVINDQTAYAMTDMLKGVVNNGTASRLNYRYKLNAVVGGKTGTTQANADGWFIGITPRLVTGVWTGCENRDFAIRSTSVGQGAASALPVFAYYMQKVYANSALGYSKTENFALPKSGEVTIELNCDAYAQQVQGVGEVEEKLGF